MTTRAFALAPWRRRGSVPRARSVLSGAAAVSIALGGTSLWTVAVAAPVHACSCVPTTDAQELRRAEVVFIGTVISHEVTRTSDRAVFDVVRVDRGAVDRPREVVIMSRGTSCGDGSWTAGNYLVAATRSAPSSTAAGTLSLGTCGSGVLRELSPEQALALSMPVPAPSIDGEGVGPAAVVASALLAGAGLGLVSARRRRATIAP